MDLLAELENLTDKLDLLEIDYAICGGLAIAQVTDPLPPDVLVEECPPAVSEIIMRALQRNPDSRYQDITDMRQELIHFLATSDHAVIGVNVMESLDPPQRQAHAIEKIRQQQLENYLNLFESVPEWTASVS